MAAQGDIACRYLGSALLRFAGNFSGKLQLDASRGTEFLRLRLVELKYMFCMSFSNAALMIRICPASVN